MIRNRQSRGYHPRMALRIGEVARHLGVSVGTVRAIPAERLPVHTTEGGQRRYEAHDVATYLRSQGRAVPAELLAE